MTRELSAPIDVVRSLYDSFAARDVEVGLKLLDEDIVLSQDPAIPWGGIYAGQDAALQFFAALAETIDSSVRVEALFEAGDTVVQYGRTVGTVRANGATFDIPECHVWTVRDGRVVEGRMYIDSTAMLDAIGR